jgi:hypothetical protein
MLVVAPELWISEDAATIHGQRFSPGERVDLTDTLDVVAERFFEKSLALETEIQAGHVIFMFAAGIALIIRRHHAVK